MDSGDAAIIGSMISGISGVLIAVINRPKNEKNNIRSADSAAEQKNNNSISGSQSTKKRKPYFYLIPVFLILISISGFILSNHLKKDILQKDPSDTQVQSTVDYRDLCSRPILASDLQDKSVDELALIRNTIYAMHGYIFHKNPKMIAYFNSKPWYVPKQDFDEERDFSKMNKDNINLIKSFENNLKNNH